MDILRVCGVGVIVPHQNDDIHVIARGGGEEGGHSTPQNGVIIKEPIQNQSN